MVCSTTILGFINYTLAGRAPSAPGGETHDGRPRAAFLFGGRPLGERFLSRRQAMTGQVRLVDSLLFTTKPARGVRPAGLGAAATWFNTPPPAHPWRGCRRRRPARRA